MAVPPICYLLDFWLLQRRYLVPQVGDLNKILELKFCDHRGLTTDEGLIVSDDVALYFAFDDMEKQEYFETAEYLKMIMRSDSGAGLYYFTNVGEYLASQPVDTQAKAFAKIIINSWIFLDLIELAETKGVFTDDDIDAVIHRVTNPQGVQRYSEIKLRRTRKIVIEWLQWLAVEFGCFTVSSDGYQPH